MLSIVFLFLFVLFINTSKCLSPITNYNYYINTKSNDSFYQDDPQNPVQITNYVFNIYGKDVDINKLSKLSDDKTVDPVLNVKNTNQVNIITIQNKDKEVEKVLKVHDDYTLYPGHGYYKCHNNTTDWKIAKYICELEGAHLVLINSQAEADLLLGIKKTNNYTEGIAVGFYKTSTYNEFVTVLGGRLSDTGYNKWHSSYPRTTSGYDYGYMWNDGLLYNDLFSTNFPFICEI